MALGPIDFIVVEFPGDTLSVDVVSGLRDLVSAGTIRIIDLLFVRKDADGGVSLLELSDLDDTEFEGWNSIVSDVLGYLDEDDSFALADVLEPGHSAVLTLIENTWATHMVRAIQAADGEVLISDRIPRQIVDELIANH